MRSRNPATWMWAEACHMIEQAERLHRQFFRPAGTAAHAAWEPPVDVFEDDGGFEIFVALPGVPADRIEVLVEGGTILVRAQCGVPAGRSDCLIHRMEIPHGRFERRIEMPPVPLTLDAPRAMNGVLALRLRKVDAR